MMPYFDGTGPRGMGPMTGRGMGWCCPYGWGSRGWGRGRGFRAQGKPATFSPKDEKALLEDEAKFLGQELKAIQDRLEELK